MVRRACAGGRAINPSYYDVSVKSEALTGALVRLNTKFSIQGEPIVASPEDALPCHSSTGPDAPAIESYLLTLGPEERDFECSGRASRFRWRR